MEYKDTIFLPKSSFEMRANLPTKEPKILEEWDKEEIFKRHFEKSLVVLETFRKWGQLSEIANMDLQDSSERIFNVLKNSIEFLELKFKLERNIKNQ